MKEVALLLPPIFMLSQANLLEAQTFREASNLLRPAENIPALGGACAVDFDNNGYPDVFIATCSLEPQNSIKHLLRNNGDGTFTDVNVAAGVNDSLSSWGIV